MIFWIGRGGFSHQQEKEKYGEDRRLFVAQSSVRIFGTSGKIVQRGNGG
jgi:hypothetical protein